MRPPPHQRHTNAFTLIELIAVLAMLAILAALAVTSLTTGSIDARRRATLNQLHAILAAQRVIAMDTAAPRTVTLQRPLITDSNDPTSSHFTLTTTPERPSATSAATADPQQRRIDDAKLVPIDPAAQLVESLTVRFDRRGRANARLWSFAHRQDPNAPDTTDPLHAGITFDPLSGSPALRTREQLRTWIDTAPQANIRPEARRR